MEFVSERVEGIPIQVTQSLPFLLLFQNGKMESAELLKNFVFSRSLMSGEIRNRLRRERQLTRDLKVSCLLEIDSEALESAASDG